MTPAAASPPAPGRMRLSLGAPVLAGSIVLALAATGVGIAARTPVEKRVGAAGVVQLQPPQTQAVRHARGGTVEVVHVAQGRQVAAGDLLISLETGALAEALAKLRAEASAADRQLAAIRQRVAELASGAGLSSDRQSEIAKLEVKLHEIEREGVALIRRTALAEQELARAVVRAPVAGRIMRLADTGAVLSPGAVVAEIEPAVQPVTILAAIDSPMQAAIAPGTPVRVWPTSAAAASPRPLRARVAEVADIPAGALLPARRLLRIELADPRPAPLPDGMAARVSIALGTHSLLEELIEPVRRLLNRASRA